jgi:hypothetical protein
MLEYCMMKWIVMDGFIEYSGQGPLNRMRLWFDIA